LLSSFFKYTSINTAKAILTNQSFRFSSPLTFNDPFDIQTQIYTEFDADDLKGIVLSRIKEYVCGKKIIPDSKYNRENYFLVLKKSLNFSEENFNKIKEDLIILVDPVLIKIKNNVNYNNSAWLKGMKRSRVFCVTEDKGNLLMWAHYAQDHKGLVFEIENIHGSNNILSNIKKVSYGEKPISYFTLEELFDWVFFLEDPDFEKMLFHTYACYKSNHWDYEKEWRVLYDTQSLDQPALHFDRRFDSIQLKSISFGCNSRIEDILEIGRMAKLVNPKVELYKAKKKDREFALFFEKCDFC
jgi:hypothetical protein